MDLRRYLFEYDITQKDFAEKIGYTPQYVALICKRKCIPSKRLQTLIENATNGIVTFQKKENVDDK